MHPHDHVQYKTRWVIRRYADDAAFCRGEAHSESTIDGNLLLNEGIGTALDLIGGIGSPLAFNNANAHLGVGDSTAAVVATQTALQATVNRLYRPMSATFPQRVAQSITWRAVFGGTEANYAWQEFSVANGNSDAAMNLNRMVSAQGTKASGQTWTLDLTITLS